MECVGLRYTFSTREVDGPYRAGQWPLTWRLRVWLIGKLAGKTLTVFANVNQFPGQ